MLLPISTVIEASGMIDTAPRRERRRGLSDQLQAPSAGGIRSSGALIEATEACGLAMASLSEALIALRTAATVLGFSHTRAAP
jgi:hypothetical protein